MFMAMRNLYTHSLDYVGTEKPICKLLYCNVLYMRKTKQICFYQNNNIVDGKNSNRFTKRSLNHILIDFLMDYGGGGR